MAKDSSAQAAFPIQMKFSSLTRRAALPPAMLALADQLLVSGSNFLLLIYLGRHLDANDFGLFSLAMLATLFFSNLHRAVLTRPMEVLAPNATGPQQLVHLRALLRALLLAMPLVLLALALLSHWLFPDARLLWACVAYVLGFGVQETLRRYAYMQGRAERAFRLDGAQHGCLWISMLALDALIGVQAWLVFAIMAGAAMLCSLPPLLRLLRQPGSAPQPTFSQLARQHWLLAKWLLLTVLAVWGAGQVYPLLIAPLGPEAVAQFAACGNILRISGAVMLAVDNYLPARAALVFQREGSAALRAHLWRHLLLCGLAASLAALLLFLLAGPVLFLAYHGSYDDSVPILRMMLPGALFSFLATLLGTYSVAMADSRAPFLTNLAAGACTFSLGLFLIQTEGIAGAALASSLTALTALLAQGALVLLRLRQVRAQETLEVPASGGLA